MKVASEVKSSHVCEKRSKVSVQSEAPGSGGINGQLAVCVSILLAPVVQTLDSAIHRINHYLVDKY